MKTNLWGRHGSKLGLLSYNPEAPMGNKWLFICWAGGLALLSYTLVYALRKPFTAAEFKGLTAWGMDYKILVSMVQLVGYVCSKMLGIRFISELRPSGRLRFIIGSAALSEASLLAFGLLPVPYNVFMLFFNGLSLGCMWGVIFSFLEGRRTTDILAAIMGVSMALSSGLAKSMGLYALHTLHISQFWMPALIGALAFPLLSLLGWLMTRLPAPTADDIRSRTKRVTLDGHQRWQIFKQFMPVLIPLFAANLMLTLQRDIKEDFIVCIIDTSTIPSWLFAKLDGIATLLLLSMFAVLSTVRSHTRVLCILLGLSTIGMALIAWLGAAQPTHLSTAWWLFMQTFCIDIAYLSFQTQFFERFIACFRIHGNVGFFIITVDFIGYAGTLALLLYKEIGAREMNWRVFYNELSVFIGLACCAAFVCSTIWIVREKLRMKRNEPACASPTKLATM